MNFHAARSVRYTGSTIEISAMIYSQARLTDALFQSAFPCLSKDKMTDGRPRGPTTYVLAGAEARYGGEPVLIFYQKAFGIGDMELLAHQVVKELCSFPLLHRLGLIGEIKRGIEFSCIGQEAGLDPVDYYMSGRFPEEVRIGWSDFETGFLELDVENDHPGIICQRQIWLDKKTLAPGAAENIEQFLRTVRKNARTAAAPPVKRLPTP